MAKDTRERILAATLEMFSQNGYSGTNIRELTASPGLAKSSMNKHFEIEEMFPHYAENTDGLTIITNGGSTLLYGRKNEPVRTFQPFRAEVASTHGAGDTFKAGCTYALANGMKDDELVRFASACAGVAVSRYPMQLDPPELQEIKDLTEHGRIQ